MNYKFNDFSRFKNNQLRSYFRKKEDTQLSFKNPFSSAVLSALTIAILWSAKDNYPALIENVWLKYFFYPIIIIVFYTIIYVIYYIVFDWISILYQKIINTLNLKGRRKKDKYYLDIFKFEVVNQVSLALSIISHKVIINSECSQSEKQFLELENRFYVVEAFYHLNDALEILQSDILLSPFYNKIIDDSYTKINQTRIKELVDLSTSLFFQFRDFWQEQGVVDFYKNELEELKTTIKDIENRVALKKAPK